MSKVKVTVDFRLVLAGDERGVPPDLEGIVWSEVIRRGLKGRLGKLGVIDIEPGYRKLQYVGSPPKRSTAK